MPSFTGVEIKSQQRESEPTRESSPREVKTRGERIRKQDREKPQGSKGDTIFYSESES